MPDEVTLRRARTEDLEFLYQLMKIALGPYVEQTFGPWNDAEQRARFFQVTQAPAHQIVELGGERIGCLSVRPGEGALHLNRVFLLPGFQNRGIGTRLVRQVLAQAAALGLPVRLRVLKVNPARGLYLRLGFVVTGEIETHVLMEYAH